MKKLKLLLLSFLTVISTVAYPVAVAASTASDDICKGVTTAAGSGSGKCNNDSSANALSRLLKLGIQIFQTIVGVISVFVLILAGLNYVTSGGDASKTKAARERIIYACIGISVVVMSQLIVSFVLNRISTQTNL